MLAAAQCLFKQFDAFDGAFSLGSQFGAAECDPQFFQPLVVAAGDGTQTAGFISSLRGLCVLLHAGVNLSDPYESLIYKLYSDSSIAIAEIALTKGNCRALLGLDSRGGCPYAS